MKAAHLVILASTVATLAACDRELPTYVGGAIYDFRMAVEASAATAIPGGTATPFVTAGVLDSLRFTLRGLPKLATGSTYSLFSVNDANGTAVVARAGLNADSAGSLIVTVPAAALATGTSAVLGFGAAEFTAANKPLYFQFRNPTTNALLAAGAVRLGRYAGATSTTFVLPAATRWGRAGLWFDMPDEGDIWLRGYILHTPLAPNGFEWHAWAVDLAANVVLKAERLGVLTDTTGTVFASFETPPANEPLPELGKTVFDARQSALSANLLTMTHVFVTLEPRGTTPTVPSAAVVYRGTFPRQFTLQRPTS
jgi:hypothetical protein